MALRSMIVALGGSLLMAACAANPPVTRQAPTSTAAICATCQSPLVIATEVAQLRQALQASVPQQWDFMPGRDATWIALARHAIATAGLQLRRQQLLVVVDRNPHVQQLALVLADPTGHWQVIGGSKVSTGQAGRRGYFITPIGVFRHDGHILDYRALGTFNENHVRGLGVKGMRVWDFGWQIAEKGWQKDAATGEIRLLMHATDPTHLESRLGKPASEGCVRIPAAMNLFLDTHGILDREYQQLATDDRTYAALLSPGLQPTPLAGDKLVIVDSSLLPAAPGALK